MIDTSHYPGSELHLFRDAHNWKAYLSRQLKPFISGHVLEVGAGLGGTTRKLHDGRVESWTCLEPDETMADALPELTHALLDRHGNSPEVIAGTLLDVESTRTFDTILYIDVLEHIEQDAAELKLARERLNPRGRIVVLSPAMQWLFSPFDASIGHYRRYTKSGLRALLPERCAIECERYLDLVGVLASGANRLLLRSSMPTRSQIELWDRWMVPLSERVDPWLGYRLGKSVLCVFQTPAEQTS